jgi:coenzyme PQQ precursor peptide PqqA
VFKLAHYRPLSHENHELDFLIWSRRAGPVCHDNADGRVQGHAGRSSTQEIDMWIKPEYTEMRFGFEVTMYIANR